MINEPTVDRNIVILFDDKLSNEFIKMSEKISGKLASKIRLSPKDEIPHITLYMTKYPQRNIPKVIEILSEMANHLKPFQIKLNSKSCHSSGTIFIDAELSPDLLSLHTKLVDKLNPLREGLFIEDELSLPGMTEEHKKSLVDNGMWAVKQNYVPHVSVGRVSYPKREGDIALAELPENVDYQTPVNRIAFVERGHDGTCRRILQTFRLNE